MGLPPLKIFSNFSQLTDQADFNRFVSAWAQQVHSMINDSLIPTINSNQQDSVVTGADVAISPSSGAFSSTSGSFLAVTNMSLTLTSSGRPVVVFVVPDGTSAASYLQVFSAGTNAQGDFQLLRNPAGATVTLGVNSLIRQEAGAATNALIAVPPNMAFLDSTAPAAANTYTFYARQSGGGTVYVNRCRLMAYEI